MVYLTNSVSKFEPKKFYEIDPWTNSIKLFLHNLRNYLRKSSHSHKNEGKWAASFCRKVAAFVPDMFCNFYIVKKHNVVNNSAFTETREKISTYLESLEWKMMYVWLN